MNEFEGKSKLLMKYLLSLDQGTTSSRSILFDLNGHLIASSKKKLSLSCKNQDFIEQDPLEIFQTQVATIEEVLTSSQINPLDIEAIGITNQRETTIIWDKLTGNPIYPAISWQDRRTKDRCELLKNKETIDLIHQKTGLLIDPYFSATKIEWILNHVHGAKKRAENGELLFGTVDSWLIYLLTQKKVHATDFSNASRTLLFDIKEKTFDPTLCQLFDIPMQMLPKALPNATFFGEAILPCLKKPIPITGVAGDQQAALFGQGCFEEGMIKTTYGTGCFVLMNIGKKIHLSENDLLTTIAWDLNNETTYAFEGSIFSGGSALEWLKEGIDMVSALEEIESLAHEADRDQNLIFIPALTGLGAPHWDPHAKGAIFGITRSTKASHIALATLQGIGFLVYESIDAMKKEAKIKLKTLFVDGKVSDSDILLQFQSDLLQIEIKRPTSYEITAFGAALLAGLGAKIFPSLGSIQSLFKVKKTFIPNPSIDYEELKKRYHLAIELIKKLEDPHHE